MEGELQVCDNTAKYQPRPPGTTSRFKQLSWVAKKVELGPCSLKIRDGQGCINDFVG